MRTLLAILCYFLAGVASGASVSLAWDQPTDSTIIGYTVHYGISSGSYSAVFDAGNAGTTTIGGLADGVTYYFVVNDYALDGTTSSYSNEVTATTPSLGPSASFSANPSSGPAPLSVMFTNLSTNATSYAWAFGDGGTSTVVSPAYVYQSPGSFTATLSATGPGGTAQAATLITVTSTATITMGETAILPNGDSGNAGLIHAQWATLSQAGTLQSISFYITNVAGQFRLGVYDDANGPSALKAQTNSITPAVGWNTANMIAPVALGAGKYWIAYLASDNNLGFVKAQDATSDARFYAVPYGPLPTTFGASQATASHFSLYATLGTGGPPPPPPPTDTTPPVVTISYPPDGAIVKGQGTLTITASATDNIGVVSMSLAIDGATVKSVNATSISYGWNLRNLAKGPHTIAATANDAAGNQATKTITVRR